MTQLRMCIFIIVVVGLALAALPSGAQPPSSPSTCAQYSFARVVGGPKGGVPAYKKCVDLPVLSSFLHFNYHPANATLEVAYRHAGVPASRWVVWSINPGETGMVGAQCLVALRKPDGSVRAYTSPVTSYDTELKQGDLTFNVTELTAVTHGGDELIIFATLTVPANKTVVNQVWQDGPLAPDGTPLTHSTSGPNVRSMASLDLSSGVSSGTTAAGDAFSLKNIHGLLNGMSWGIMMPMGAIIARYMRVFPSADPAWFYLHVSCQMTAYALGVAGVATGMKLGDQWSGPEYSSHGNIGYTLLFFGTLQMIAHLIRPKKDHKYRIYWNVYHHSVGYSTIILSIVNVFEGLSMLNPAQGWKTAYIGVIVSLALVALSLEAFTWYVVLKRRRSRGSGLGGYESSKAEAALNDGSYRGTP